MSKAALKQLSSFKPFNTLLSNCKKSAISIANIDVQSIDYFKDKVGFVKLKADATYNGTKVPGIAVLRGNSVGILVILRSEEDPSNVYTTLVSQPRFPTGKVLLELPAGMWDSDDQSFAGSAARELEEECGIKITNTSKKDADSSASASASDSSDHGSEIESQLVSLNNKPIYLSPGLLDEGIYLYKYEETMPEKRIKELAQYTRDSSDENEHITVKVVPLQSLLDNSEPTPTDSKLLIALHLYLLRGGNYSQRN